MLRELCDFLRARGCGIQSLELRLVHREAGPTRVTLRLTRPTAEFAHLADLVHERLAQLQIVEPVRTLRLRTCAPTSLPEGPDDLLATDRNRVHSGAPQLIERLRARLGNEVAYGLRLVQEHRPESAWEKVREPLAWESGRDSSAGARGIEAGVRSSVMCPRPLWLLDQPRSLADADWPDLEDLELEEGPERIETGWWDGRDVARDYYVALTRAGIRLWVYRERSRQGGWFLHGVFG
jgi:protein ImuB